MNRPARTLTRDLVRRRHPTGASPSRRIAPGRTLSPMPSEQKGAYGGHLALLRSRPWRTCDVEDVETAKAITRAGHKIRVAPFAVRLRRPVATPHDQTP